MGAEKVLAMLSTDTVLQNIFEIMNFIPHMPDPISEAFPDHGI